MVKLRARVRTDPKPLPVKIFLSKCRAALDTEKAGAPSLTVQTSLDFSLEPVVGTTRVDVSDVAVSDLDDGDLTISGDLGCAIIDGFVKVIKSLEEKK